jgi:hypothetical protein
MFKWNIVMEIDILDPGKLFLGCTPPVTNMFEFLIMRVQVQIKLRPKKLGIKKSCLLKSLINPEDKYA